MQIMDMVTHMAWMAICGLKFYLMVMHDLPDGMRADDDDGNGDDDDYHLEFQPAYRRPSHHFILLRLCNS